MVVVVMVVVSQVAQALFYSDVSFLWENGKFESL